MSDRCKYDGMAILYYAKTHEWYHPSVVMSMRCLHPEPKETVT